MTNEELVIQYQSGYKLALDELIEQHKNLVKFFANKYKNYCPGVIDFNDLQQEGWIAFIEAASKFNIREDDVNKFSSFAGVLISRRILDVITSNRSRTHKSYSRGKDVSVGSLNEIVEGTDGATLMDAIPDETSEFLHPDNPFLKIEEELYLEELRDDLFSLLDQVLDNDFSATLIVEYYGLNGDPINQYELADKYNMGKSRIQYLISEGIRTIRRSEEGKAFMRKYQVEYTEMVIQKKESFNEFQSPDKLIMKMEIIDDLLDNIMSKCGVSEE
ncbi:sigma-70 family RNA polymerase sigma factor [Clostridiisalibacter paucivorans]|uniref:sigma-70 family RNA polymerase sigma factor n=1 Tax=Clostridiisalibacter paucivorans TaxID=408753 RepID=UPI000479F6DD|nr:sigma-70 family RNA polymerase sigma factor [Clostridiisalibacter paucivorans]